MEPSVRSNAVQRHGAYVHDFAKLQAWADDWVEPEIKRVLIAGDIHADWGHAQDLVRRAQAEGCQAIFVVGDYGYWPHQDKDRRSEEKLEKALARAGIMLYWVDGNHENYTALNYERPLVGQGFRIIHPHIVHVPRGTRWEWNGISFLGFGGAHSTDKEWRRQQEAKRKRGQQKHWFWWPEELITDDDEIRAAQAGDADILFAHDAPAQVYLPRHLPSFNRDDLMTNMNRDRVGRVLAHSGAKMVFHGHYHQRYETDIEVNRERVRVQGLGRNREKGSWTVLDLDSLAAGGE
jgi:predicted phosphodiesterase